MAKLFDNIYDPKVHKHLEEYTIENVQDLGEKEWTVNITAFELARLWHEGKLIYYPSTQRGVRPKTVKGVTKLVPIFNRKRVVEIQKTILQGRYFADQLTINILSDDGVVCYDEEKSTLTILNGLMCMLDGQHRTRALVTIYDNMLTLKDEQLENLLKNLKFSVKITNYDVDTAAQQFYQLAQGEQISKSRAESFNKSEAPNRIINRLNDSGSLKHMIDTTRTSISKTDENHIVTFSTMISAFKDSFERIEDEKSEKDVYEFLSEFFKELLTIYPEMKKFESRNVSKVSDLTCENFMFYAYMDLAAYLYDFKNKNWKDMMKHITKIDLNKSDNLWLNITRETENGRVIINNATTRQTLRRIYIREFKLL